MKTILERPREIPVYKEVDVLVAGGGYAGFGAAMCAARNGARTMLVEQQSALGGLVTLGYVALTFSYIEGVGYELFERLRKENAVKGRFVDPEKTKRVLEQMLIEEGVTILYHTTIIDSIVENDTIQGVVIHSKAGRQAILAKRVVDASGDGDVAAYAGVPFECGYPKLNNYNQATSLVCRIGNVDYERYKVATETVSKVEWWKQKIDEAVKSGLFPYMIDKRINWIVVVPYRDHKHQELCVCYAHSRHCRNLDPEDLTRQIIEQRQQNEWFTQFCRKYIPGFANAWLIDTAPMLGVRDSRRIMCEYKVTVDDIVDGRKFPDAIMRGMHALDAHHPTDVGHIKHVARKDSDGRERKCYVNPGSWREIPYRAIVTKKIDNLLVAGRNFSADFMAQSGNRLVLECLNMGQAAGTAAALSVKDNVTPRKLDVEKLQKRLEKMDINIFGDPRYGTGDMLTGQTVKAEDILHPEDNPTGQATTVLKTKARAKYKFWTDQEELFLKEKEKQQRLVAKGYTANGGDVGTNLE